MKKKILVLNFGSTSTKVAVYENTKEIIMESIQHPQEKLRKFGHVMDQKEFRREEIMEYLEKHNYKFEDFDCVISRGGNCRPIPSGIYEISEKMLADIVSGKYGVHPTGLGCSIAHEIGKKYEIPAITANPPIVDEFDNIARFSGIKEIERVSSFHVLNHKAIARSYCKAFNKNYEDINLIITHMGGGISVAAHNKGKMIDANNALDGDGPFSPERAGSLPVGDLIKMCYSGKYTLEEMLKKIRGGGGLMSYLGTSSGLEVEKMIQEGNKYAEAVYEAMAYQVSKEIGACATVLKGKVEAIIFTGSLAYSELFSGWVSERVKWIADIVNMAGENEMQSLAENANLYLQGEEQLKEY